MRKLLLIGVGVYVVGGALLVAFAYFVPEEELARMSWARG